MTYFLKNVCQWYGFSNAWIAGWFGTRASSTLWVISSFQILFHEWASPQFPPPILFLPRSPSLQHTRHQSRQYLHISQQIISVEHNPCRELSNIHCGPPLILFFFPSSHPLRSMLNSKTRVSLLFHWFMPFLVPQTPSVGIVSAAEIPKAIGVPHRSGLTEKNNMCVLYLQREQLDSSFLIYVQIGCAKWVLTRRGCSSIEMISFIHFHGMTLSICHSVPQTQCHVTT